MPVHQISVVPVAKETASNGRTPSRTKDKSKEKEGEKEIRRSGSRSSNISKTSSSNQGAGPNSLSRASVTPSSQDICSSSVPLKVEANHPDQTTVVLPISPAPSSVPVTKRQVKRRHRRRRESSGGGGGGGGAAGCVAECVDVQQQTVRARANTHSRTRTHSDSSDEEEQDERRWRETRSWSRQKARRHRSGSHPAHATTHPLDEAGSARDGTQLLSVCSDEGQKENQPPPVDEGTTGTGLKSRRKRSSKGEEQGSKAANHSRGSGRSSGRGSGRGSGRASEEEERQTITKSYEERGSGDSNMAVPTSQKCTNTTTPTANQNGCTQMPCSDDEMEVCRICHCEGDEDCPLITPCHCTGSLRFVHQDCLHQWIKSSDTRCCELCKFDFIMETHLKPLRKWEKLHMTTCELRKIYFSVSFHLFAVVCVIWSLYVLIDRTAEEIKQGKNQEFLRFSLLNAVGVLEWPFWTKLIVVAVGLAGGLVFMYVQCKVYLQLWRRLKAFNRIIFVQNCPATVRAAAERAARPAPVTNGKHEGPAPGTQTNIPRSASTGSAGVAPV